MPKRTTLAISKPPGRRPVLTPIVWMLQAASLHACGSHAGNATDRAPTDGSGDTNRQGSSDGPTGSETDNQTVTAGSASPPNSAGSVSGAGQPTSSDPAGALGSDEHPLNTVGASGPTGQVNPITVSTAAVPVKFSSENCAHATGTVPLEDGSKAIAIGDWNADGNQDLATVNDSDSGTFHVLLGCGDGSFLRMADQKTIANAVAIISVNLNDDPKADLVMASLHEFTVSLALDDGVFAAPVTYPMTYGTPSLVHGDFDGDGIQDIAVASGNALSVLLGLGDGTLGARVDYEASRFYTMVLGDINGDGALDLVGSGPQVYLGKGDGTFLPNATPSVAEPFANSAAIGDFTADGNLDLGIADWGPRGGSPYTGILAGNGDGSFDSMNTLDINTPNALQTGDVDNDGDADLLALYTNSITALLQGDDGTLGAASVSASWGGQSFALGDVDDDGNLDVAVATDHSVFVLLGRGDGTFDFADTSPALGSGDYGR